MGKYRNRAAGCKRDGTLSDAELLAEGSLRGSSRASDKTKDDLAAFLKYVTRERQFLVFRQGKRGKLLAALAPLDDERQLERLRR